MKALFRNELHQAFGTWPLAYVPYGGADFGEVRAVAEAIGDGDDGAYYKAWTAAAGRLQAEAEAALVADPGAWSIADGFRAAISHMFDLPPEAVQNRGALDQSIKDRADAAIRRDGDL